MQKYKIMEVKGQRVLTTSQLAEAYETETKIITNNYSRNKSRYMEGKHVIILSGDGLKNYKAKHQIDATLKYSSKLYLWTEKGALLHAKSLNTDKAWEVYDYLVDFYFRAKEQQAPDPAPAQIPQIEDKCQQEEKELTRDEKRMWENRGFLEGVYMFETRMLGERLQPSAMFDKLSPSGKRTVMRGIFGEGVLCIYG